MPRPTCDIVVPFAGSQASLDALLVRLATLTRAPGDSLTVVDNRPVPSTHDEPPDGLRLIRVPEVQSSYHARNRGAAGGEAAWVVFLDADVEAPADLLDRYFEPPPAPGTAVLAGGIRDVEGAPGLAGRYSVSRGMLDQDNTLVEGRAYAKTANCAVRRDAFEAVGGFAPVRSGGDADLCLRITAGHGGIERRDGARVVHRSRSTVPRLLRQQLRYGAGAAWLAERHPAFAPDVGWGRLARWLVRAGLEAARQAARGRTGEAAETLLDPITRIAFETGRALPNAPGSIGAVLRARLRA